MTLSTLNSNIGLKLDLFSSLNQTSFGPNVAKVAQAIDTADTSLLNGSERQTLSTLTHSLAADGDLSQADSQAILATLKEFSGNQSIAAGNGGCYRPNPDIDFSKCLKPLLNALVDAISSVIGQKVSDMVFEKSVANVLDGVADGPWKGALQGAFDQANLSLLNPQERSELLSMLSVSAADGNVGFAEASCILGKLNEFCGEPPISFPKPEAPQWSVEQCGSKANIDLGDYTLSINEKHSELVLTNKETGESSRIWGDPHFDIDNDGKNDMDFWGDMTLNLENGTKITIQTTEYGKNEKMTLSSRLVITQGDQAIVVNGMDQNTIGDMTITQSKVDGALYDAFNSDGLDIYENSNGSGWLVRDGFEMRSVTQADMNTTKGEQSKDLDFRMAIGGMTNFIASAELLALLNGENE